MSKSKLNKSKIGKVLPNDKEFPKCFLDLPDFIKPIKQIYFIGDEKNLNAFSQKCISIVGSRASTSYGNEISYSFAKELSGRGWTIASGGAFGIDAFAHKGALDANGKTVAFIAGGLNNLYPKANLDLFERIIENDGIIMSENEPEETNMPHEFLERNRLIALYSQTTVVVEAAWRSGALSTAAHANKLLIPVAGVPGPITLSSSSGVHELIRNNRAELVTSVDDILELAQPIGQSLFEVTDNESLQILNVIDKKSFITAEKISEKSKLPFQTVMSKLTKMELEEIITTDGIGWKAI
ncbi:MAG: DNA-processing protein DprA [Bifidobacteriaceae bacterium]|jgi:DNA processing protein|nr:DNA-processing protein DprA [Bifidobacteriaceae bacterium]